MSLCEQEEWKLYCALKHTWKINLKDNNTLSSTFRSHNGNCEWCLSLQPTVLPVIQRVICSRCESSCNNYCPRCGLFYSNVTAERDRLQHYYLQVRLQELAKKYFNLNKKKLDIQILNTNNMDESIKKEVCIDKDSATVSIYFGDLEEIFLLNGSNFTIVVRIFDIANQSTGGFENLLKSGECSDFKIIVNKKQFLVHKCILAAKSSYFSAMFKHNTKETVESFITIPDIRVEVMNELINFIYGAKVDLKDDLLYDLLTAADMYQLKDLKTICETTIASNLTIENLEECLEYADTYNNEILKNETIQFINQKKQSGYKFSDDDINHLEGRLTSVSSSYLVSLVCSLLK